MAGIHRVRRLRDELDRFHREIDLIVAFILQKNDDYITAFNAEDQMYEQGVNAKGIRMDDFAPYHPITVRYKKMANQPFDRVTLRDEGDFHLSLELDIGTDSFCIVSTDVKAPKLQKRYKAIGLTEDSLRQVIWDYLYPDLEEYFHNLEF